MNKRLKDEYAEFVYKGEPTPFSLGTLAVVGFCTVLLIVATFTKIDISHWWLFNDGGLEWGVKKHSLVPQIPIIMMMSAFLGARFGVLVVILYILTGFFIWPVFGFGGGLEYVKSYFFGYILGFLVATIFAGRILSHKFDIKNMLYASVIGVLAIHICGILYSFILGFFNSSAYRIDVSHLYSQIVYDVIFSMIAILLAKPIKYILWVAMKNESKRRVKAGASAQRENK